MRAADRQRIQSVSNLLHIYEAMSTTPTAQTPEPLRSARNPQPRRSGFEILQSCKREGWKPALAEVLELNGQVKVIFPDGRTAYAHIEG